MGSGAQNVQNLRNSVRYDQGYRDGLIGSRIHAFDWYQHQWPWMTLNGWNVTLAEINKIYEPTRKISTTIDLDDFERLKRHSCRNKQNLWAHQKNFNDDRRILSAEKCRPMIVVSKNIRYMRIFAGIPGRGVNVKQCMAWIRQFYKPRLLTPFVNRRFVAIFVVNKTLLHELEWIKWEVWYFSANWVQKCRTVQLGLQ